MISQLSHATLAALAALAAGASTALIVTAAAATYLWSPLPGPRQRAWRLLRLLIPPRHKTTRAARGRRP